MAQTEERTKDTPTHRVLLCVQSADDVSILQDILAGIGAQGVVCPDLEGTCWHTVQDADAVLLTEQSVVSGSLAVLAEALHAQPAWSDLPVLFIATGGAESPLAVQAMQELPNVVVLDRPVRIATLAGVLRMASRVRDKQRQVRDLLEALRRLKDELEDRVLRRTTELEHRTRQLQKLALVLSQTEDRERKRIAEILHDDVQQQLAAAKFHLSLLDNRLKDHALLREAATQVGEMIKDAIAKTRILSHELSPAMLYYGDFGETIEWLAKQMQAKHGLTVHVQVPGPIEVSSDPIKAFLFRTVQEILFNIVKHAQVTEAAVRLRRRNGQLRLTVCDRGRGFDLSTLGKTGGFGLLSIRERVELLGGQMKIRSAPGRGSTFRIAVPDGEASLRAVPVEQEAVLEIMGTPGRCKTDTRIRVLLADDHKVVREGLAALLNEQEDIEIVGQATNGREAVDLAHELEPDVVVMDVAMPIMAGDEATRQIKQHMPQARVIGLSMFEEPGIVERMHKAGADRYMVKTAPAEELLAAIRKK